MEQVTYEKNIEQEALAKVLKQLTNELMITQSQINYCEDLETTSSSLIDYLTKCKDIILSYMKKDSSITLLAENTKQNIEKQMKLFYRNLDNLVKVQGLSEDATVRMKEIHESNKEMVGGFEKALSILNNIATQTKILSINSSIEAARIGEKGLAFKIISREVQKLSESTSHAASEMSGSTQKIKEQSDEMEEMLTSTHSMLAESVTDLNKGKDGFKTMHHETDQVVKESIVLEEVMQTTLDLIDKAHNMIEFNKVSFTNIKRTLLQQATSTESMIRYIRDVLSIKESIASSKDFNYIQQRYYEQFQKENKDECIHLIQSALNEGFAPDFILTQIVERSVEKIGKEQIQREVPLSEIYINGRIIEESLQLLLPLIKPETKKDLGTIVIGNAFGDYHALGRQIVTTFLKLTGFNVIDLGLSVSNENFVETAKAQKADLICVSALIIHTAKEIKELRNLLNESGMGRVKILAGGAPFNFEPRLAKEVGADQMARNAIEATRVAKEMLGLLSKGGA